MTQFTTITALGILAAVSPGPDFALTLRYLALGGRSESLWLVGGIAAGVMVHATYSVFGLSVIMVRSPALFTALKYAGALYLAFVGVKALLSKKVAPVRAQQAVAQSRASAFRIGFFCNALNPKTMVFFLSIFSSVVAQDTPVGIALLYGLDIALCHFAWFALLVSFLTHPTIRQTITGAQLPIARAMGGLLVFFGVRILLMA